MSMQQYLKPDALAGLCREIAMPEPAAETICQLAAEEATLAAAGFFDGLFSVQTGGEAVRQMKEAFAGNDPRGLRMLTVMLAAALKTKEDCLRRGISREVVRDTLACFSRFVTENYRRHSVWEFDRDFWAYRQLSLALFRVGALEYEMKAAGRAIGPAKAGGSVLSLHIPSDALLTRESLDASYRAAKAFLRDFSLISITSAPTATPGLFRRAFSRCCRPGRKSSPSNRILTSWRWSLILTVTAFGFSRRMKPTQPVSQRVPRCSAGLRPICLQAASWGKRWGC